jgi:hypothetical protein
MTAVSYFMLNQPYVINTVIFFGTFLIAIIWMHAHLHADVMKDLGATCDDPIAKFFNKKLAERCHVDTITKSATWVDNNLDKIVKTLELQQNATNARVLGLYKMYDERNKEKAASYAQRIADKQTAVNDLQNAVNDIKTGVSDNEKNITKFIDDYRELLRENISKLQVLATGFVNKLNRNIYSKNYKKKRKAYVNSYNKINKYIKKVNMDRMFEGVNQTFDLLPEISTDARTGKV